MKVLRMFAALTCAVLVVLLLVTFADAVRRNPKDLDLHGWEDPEGLRRHIATDREESRHFWLGTGLPFHAAEVLLLWVALRATHIKRPGSWATFIVTTQLAAYSKLCTGGWFVLVLGMAFYPLWLIVHSVMTMRALRATRGRASWVVAAGVTFLIGTLLQHDVGDGYSWLTLTAILGDGPGGSLSQPPSWIGDDFGVSFICWNCLTYLPTVACWLTMIEPRHKNHAPAELRLAA